MRRVILFLVLGLALSAVAAPAQVTRTLEVRADGASLRGGKLHFEVTLSGFPADRSIYLDVFADGKQVGDLNLVNGTHQVALEGTGLSAGLHRIAVRSGTLETSTDLRVIPGVLSVIPPLVAIGLALYFKEVLVALLLGVFSGALILVGGNPFGAFGRTIDSFVAPALADSSHAKILLFTTLLGGMVGAISKSGGTRGIVERLAPYATDSRRGQVATWLMGILIFFDDYANTLIVGSTMRPITDRLRISREKLAYIVDSTAAPVVTIVPISTWVGFEIGLLGATFQNLGLDYNPYTTFVAAIPYHFYPIFALVLGFAVALSGRDMGPMLAAERRAAATGQLLAEGSSPLADYQEKALEPPEGTPHRALNALIPILTVIVLTVVGLLRTGSAGLERESFPSFFVWIREVLSNSDSYNSLLWASLAGSLVAVLLPLLQRLLTLTQAMEGLIAGFKAMFLAMVVLLLAWSIGSVCTQLHTADYLVGLSQGVLSPHFMPVLVFLMAAGVAFATGTSWGTMGILIPLVIPVLHGLATEGGHMPGSDLYTRLLLATIASVLAGSVWGDHCSPISDTTILSSTASGSDHIAHVRTQLPYAISMGLLGVVVGNLPAAWGVSPWISIAVGSVVIILVLRTLGTRVRET